MTPGLVRRSGLTLAIGCGVVALVGACGAGTNNSSPINQLRAATQQVRDAASGGNYSDLRSQVQSLKSLVNSEVAQGEISDAAANQIDAAAERLLLVAKPAPTKTATPTTTSPTFTSPSLTTAPTTTAPSTPPTTAPTTPTTPPPTTSHTTATAPPSTSSSSVLG